VKTATQVGSLVKRSVLNTIRQPATLSSILFPLLFFAVTSAGAGRIAEVPGFPARSYKDFYLASVLVQGILFAGIGAGAALATDIEQGFVQRLLLTPLRRPFILVGLAGGAVMIGAIQATVILVVGVIAGVHIVTGVAGFFLVVALAVLVAIAFSGVGALVAARTGSSDATQSVFPLFFILMIFSSYFAPRNFIHGWFKAIATYNPATYIIEGLRSPIIGGWDGHAIGLLLVAVLGFCVVGFGGAAATLRTRLART
jgi:ABC-2 type transport system permease protein